MHYCFFFVTSDYAKQRMRCLTHTALYLLDVVWMYTAYSVVDETHNVQAASRRRCTLILFCLSVREFFTLNANGTQLFHR